MRKFQDFKWLAAGLAERPDSRGDLSHRSRHTQVPVPATTWLSDYSITWSPYGIPMESS